MNILFEGLDFFCQTIEFLFANQAYVVTSSAHFFTGHFLKSLLVVLHRICEQFEQFLPLFLAEIKFALQFGCQLFGFLLV